MVKTKPSTGPPTEMLQAMPRARITARNSVPTNELILPTPDINLDTPVVEFTNSAATRGRNSVPTNELILPTPEINLNTPVVEVNSSAATRGRNSLPTNDFIMPTTDIDLHPPVVEVSSSATTQGSDDEDDVPDQGNLGAFANFLVKIDLKVRSMELANARKGAMPDNPLQFRGNKNISHDKCVKKCWVKIAQPVFRA